MAYGDVVFGTTESRREIGQLGRFMDTFIGDYDEERHLMWAHEKCLPELEEGVRTGYGFWLRQAMNGGMVLKVEGETEVPNCVWLKYFRVAPSSISGRGVAGFMIRQAPVLARQLLEDHGALTPGAAELSVRLDTRAGSPAESFFAHAGFRVLQEIPLYDVNVLDAIMERTYQL